VSLESCRAYQPCVIKRTHLEGRSRANQQQLRASRRIPERRIVGVREASPYSTSGASSSNNYRQRWPSQPSLRITRDELRSVPQ
jgi:hypothetical protein